MYSRLIQSVGISKTIPTLVFLPNQIHPVSDILANGEEEATSFNDPLLKWPRRADLPENSVMNDVGSLHSDHVCCIQLTVSVGLFSYICGSC